jgi:hypothetical protein
VNYVIKGTGRVFKDDEDSRGCTVCSRLCIAGDGGFELEVAILYKEPKVTFIRSDGFSAMYST